MPIFNFRNSPKVPIPGVSSRFHNPYAYGAVRDSMHLFNGIVNQGTAVWSQHNYHLSPNTQNVDVNRLIMNWSARVPSHMRANK